MDKIKVLVVDDHPLMRDGIRALLYNYRDVDIVGEAAEGKEAFQKMQQLGPDVIIMDISMPVMDGLEATRKMRDQNGKAKILILTQYNTREHLQSALNAGASGYLPKGKLIANLIQAIRIVHNGDLFLQPSV